MRKAPSSINLANAFPQIERAHLDKIRRTIRNTRGDSGLASIDRLLENHGVECIHDRNGYIVATYSNSGETYAPTLLYVFESDSYRLTTLGDFVESWEKRHARLP